MFNITGVLSRTRWFEKINRRLYNKKSASCQSLFSKRQPVNVKTILLQQKTLTDSGNITADKCTDAESSTSLDYPETHITLKNGKKEARLLLKPGNHETMIRFRPTTTLPRVHWKYNLPPDLNTLKVYGDIVWDQEKTVFVEKVDTKHRGITSTSHTALIFHYKKIPWQRLCSLFMTAVAASQVYTLIEPKQLFVQQNVWYFYQLNIL